MREIRDLINISKYAGSRYDLVQAGGGNSSVKLEDGTMLVKASGILLSEMEENKGIAIVDKKTVSEIVCKKEICDCDVKKEREKLAAEIIRNSSLNDEKPSIETILHSLLGKYVLHVHPLAVNIVTARTCWKDILNSLFRSGEIAMVSYRTPGIDLALELAAELDNYAVCPQIIFLQNHGLIVHSNEPDEIRTLTEYAVQSVENYLKIDMSSYKSVTAVSDLIFSVVQERFAVHLSEDTVLCGALTEHKELFFVKPFCPDKLVYCGVRSLEIKGPGDAASIKEYIRQYKDVPRVILMGKRIYIISKNIRKAKEAEDVLKFHIATLSCGADDINYLTDDEIEYLSNWDQEKYRQIL